MVGCLYTQAQEVSFRVTQAALAWGPHNVFMGFICMSNIMGSEGIRD